MNMKKNESSMSSLESHNLLALLIGTDFYFDSTTPDAPKYQCLGGCVRDIILVEEYLKSSLGISSENIMKLTASCNSSIWDNASMDRPIEPPDKWPTYENIVAAFYRIIEMGKAGDQVYIHYSGHGGRVPTLIPKQKGEDGLDETLVPTDIGLLGSQYFRDIEMATILKRMIDKGFLVTLVLDSCHSGGLTRGRGNVAVRGTDVVDRTERKVDSMVGTIEQMADNWQGLSGATPTSRLSSPQTKSVTPANSGWLPQPKGYVLLAACRPSESAYEYAVEGNDRNGALTYFLLKSLSNAERNVTYRSIYDRLVAKIHSKFPMQTPILEGEGDRVLFGSEFLDKPYAINVMQVERTDKVLLNVGQAHGIRKGAQFAIYPYDVFDFKQKNRRLAIAEIDIRGATNSWALVKIDYNKGPIEQGSQAVLIDPASAALVKSIQIVDISESIGKEIPESDMVRLESKIKELKTMILQEGEGFIKLATENIDGIDFQLAINQRGEYEIWDPAGNPIPNVNPRLLVQDTNSALQVIQRLVHLAKYANVRDLDNYDNTSPLKGKLQIDIFATSDDFELGDKPILRPTEQLGGAKIVKQGQKLVLRIKNNFPPESGQILNFTALDLQPDWGISQIYPSSGSFASLDPGTEELLPFMVGLPSSYVNGRDIIKVFAAIDQTSFRWLELDPLDQPTLSTKSVDPAIVPKDPLEQLMSAMTKSGAATTKNISISPNASKEWTCIEVEVQIYR